MYMAASLNFCNENKGLTIILLSESAWCLVKTVLLESHDAFLFVFECLKSGNRLSPVVSNSKQIMKFLLFKYRWINGVI